MNELNTKIKFKLQHMNELNTELEQQVNIDTDGKNNKLQNIVTIKIV